MGIPLKGATEILIDSFGSWSQEIVKEEQKSQPEAGDIIVASGTLFCPKYQSKILASECATCGECISEASKDERLGKFVVKCGHKKKQILASQEDNVEGTSENSSVNDHSGLKDYNWEEEKIAEIEKVISKEVKNNNWEQIRSAQKLSAPNTMEVQFLGSSSVLKSPSAFDDGLGDRSQVANNQISMFDSEDEVENKVEEASAMRKVVESDVQKREERIVENKNSWEVDYLHKINDLLESRKDLDSIKKVANESYESQEHQTPTGKIGMFDDRLNVSEDDTSIQEESEKRADKKSSEWRVSQLEAINQHVKTASQLESNHMADQGVHKVSEEIGAGEGFKHSKDQVSMFNTSGLEDMSKEETTKDMIAESRKIKRKEIGVREVSEDRSWDDYEAQRSVSIQEQTKVNPVFQDFLDKVVSKKDSTDMEKFLIEAGKQSQKPDATSGEGGFKRI